MRRAGLAPSILSLSSPLQILERGGGEDLARPRDRAFDAVLHYRRRQRPQHDERDYALRVDEVRGRHALYAVALGDCRVGVVGEGSEFGADLVEELLRHLEALAVVDPDGGELLWRIGLQRRL